MQPDARLTMKQRLHENEPGRVVLRSGADQRWLEFTAPCGILTAFDTAAVLPLIRRMEDIVRREGLHAAGFISYEAAPGFDPALPAKADGHFPLIWFGLYKNVKTIKLTPVGVRADAAIKWRPSVTRPEYERSLRAIRACIQAGDTYQVNFTYRLRSVTDVSPWRLFRQIAGDGSAPFAAFVDTGEWAVCSASPELFLRINGEYIESRPMKGTAPRGLWAEDDQAKKAALARSEKERAENVMIVDMVRNDLARAAEPGSVQVASLFKTERYPAVWQLTSTVTARTSAPLDKILQAAFPPASITGAPKRRTMEIIADLETSPRRIYTGAVGFISPGRQAQFNVAIRTVLIHRPTGSAEYGIGGGIVWDSTPAAEHRESLAKAKTLTPQPQDFDLLETILWSPGAGFALLDYHMERLARSAFYFNFQIDPRKIRAELADIAAGLPPEKHRVRLLLSRRGRTRCEAAPLNAAALQFGSVALARKPIDRRDVFLYHKTTRRIAYETALKMRPGAADVLLFNELGQITESTLANVAVEFDGKRYTPPVRCGLLPGTQRARMLNQGLLQERIINIEELPGSRGVYLLNSVRGMQKVRIRTP